MKHIILGTFYDTHGEAHAETLMVSFFDRTLRIRLEEGARASFVVPFMPIAAYIKNMREQPDESGKETMVNGHYSNLQNNVGMTSGGVSVRYQADHAHERISLGAPGCGMIGVSLDRLVSCMDAGMKKLLEER